MNALLWTAAGLAAALAPAAQEEPAAGPARAQPARPVLVKVLRPDGRAAAGATVVCAGLPPTAGLPAVLERVRADARGRARLALGGPRPWRIWAVLDDGKKRFASRVHALEGRRALRLGLEAFPVPFVRAVGLKPWRALFGQRLELCFVPYEPRSVSFTVALPADEDPILRLPPLPSGNYFPALAARGRGILDFVYFGPAFNVNDPQAEKLYERDYPLKRFVTGPPIVLRGRLLAGGKPIPGATLRAILAYSAFSPVQTVPVAADGGFELVLARQTAVNRRLEYPIQLYAWAPGTRLATSRLTAKMLASSGKGKPGPLVIELEKARHPPAWRLEGFEPGWRLLARLALGGTSNRVGFAFEPLPGGRLPVPAFHEFGAVPYLFLVHDQDVVPLPFDAVKPPAEWTIARSSLQRFAFEVRREDGGPAAGAVLSIALRKGNAASTIRLRCGGRGRAEVLLHPGRYALHARHARHGDALGFVRVAAQPKGGPIHWPLVLAPFQTLRGTVLDPSGEPVSGAQVSVHLARQASAIPKEAAGVWIRNAFPEAFHADATTDETGAFTARVPGDATQADFYASQRLEDGTVRVGNRPCRLPGEGPVEIRLR